MDAARQILSAMLDLSQMVHLYRLPELICGFHRRTDDRPTLYPVRMWFEKRWGPLSRASLPGSGLRRERPRIRGRTPV